MRGARKSQGLYSGRKVYKTTRISARPVLRSSRFRSLYGGGEGVSEFFPSSRSYIEGQSLHGESLEFFQVQKPILWGGGAWNLASPVIHSLTRWGKDKVFRRSCKIVPEPLYREEGILWRLAPPIALLGSRAYSLYGGGGRKLGIFENILGKNAHPGQSFPAFGNYLNTYAANKTLRLL